MRTILEVLRLRLGAAPLSARAIARSLGVPRTTVQDCVARFRASGLPWPAYFGPFRSLISLQAVHPFRSKPVSRFAPSRSPVSLHVDRGRSAMT